MLSLQVRQERIEKEAQHFTKYNRKRGLRSTRFKFVEGSSAYRKYSYNLNKAQNFNVTIDERIGFTKEGVFVHQYIVSVSFRKGRIKNTTKNTEVKLIDSFGNMRFRESVSRIKSFIQQAKKFLRFNINNGD